MHNSVMKHLVAYFKSLSDYFNKMKTYCEIEHNPFDNKNFPVLILIAVILSIVILSKGYSI